MGEVPGEDPGRADAENTGASWPGCADLTTHHGATDFYCDSWDAWCVKGAAALWFGLVILTAATAALLAGNAAGRRPTPTLGALAFAGLVLTLEGIRQPRESVLFGSLLVVLAFAGLMVASLSMAVGPGNATWLPNRRGAAACTVGALVVMALGFGLVPAASR